MDAPEVVQPPAALEVVRPEFQQHHYLPGEQADLEVGRPPQQPVNPRSGSATAAGLEVARPESQGLEVHELPTTKTPGVTEAEIPRAADGSDAEGLLCGLQRRSFWIALVALLLVIIAAVLGGVLGSRKSKAGPAVTASATATSTAPSSTPTSIAANSKLAVTGWRTGQEYSIRLFFQGPDDLLRYAAYESTSGTWAEPVVSVKARAGSAIGATAFNHSIYGGDDNMQFELYYLDESNYVRAQDFRPGVTHDGSFSQENYAASPSSQLSTYWPSLIYEGYDGSFYEVTYAGSLTANVWNVEAIVQAGALMSGSGVAELTTTPDFTSFSLFWQDSSGNLVLQSRDPNNTTWSTSQTIASIPERSSIGALYAPAIGGNDSNIYVLWQDATGDIRVSDSNSGWSSSSTPDALKNADNGTSITCLTPVSWYNVSLGTGPSLARCYFRRNAAVREVEVTGGQWQVLGDVPIP